MRPPSGLWPASGGLEAVFDLQLDPGGNDW
jgi:hypothetical protein